MKENSPKLGRIIEGEAHRDAIHIAVAPVTAAERLHPGDHVLLNADGRATTRGGNAIGVVDPFLPDRVEKDEQFYLFLYPGTITGLRHEWTHPAFKELPQSSPPSKEKAKSEAWLRNLAMRERINYDELIDGAVSGNGGCFGTDDGPEQTRTAEFWEHIENVTGKHLSAEHRDDTWFRCAC